ncbi:RHS repeat-associated core domain-containing protein [Rhodanobacter lindaniclasticus]|uniref:Teneurin-like YD-shell domain-containing protein n=1 Tax=Rhodanobacter lindaniclasticus TaxID=75310 RepID=A0A4S3KCZ9_9GAMM|nr:RHS repeat-associated core domain-containing protein [Rhodanobacter lindaniclasticus]THD06342.1 hypothetical protein B1991_13370 [Rhodanobacter lindaniclasticus]
MSTMKIAALWLILSLWAGLTHAGTHHYYYTDVQGTVLAKADANGAIVATYDYAPYGTAVMNMSPAPNGPGYTGHVNDPESGFVYMQARYYDPAAGRFLSVDPMGLTPGNVFGQNRYVYANNSPYTNFDPTGTTCKRSGSGGTYSCQIDYIVTKVRGIVGVRPANAADHKAYAGVERSLTNGVNAAASSGKTVSISVRSGGSTFTFKISGAKVAQNLAGRSMVVDPNGHSFGAMYSPNRYYTYINKSGINPAHNTRYGNADRTRSVEFLHEGIHWSVEELRGFGNALPILGTDPAAHQKAYNDAASELLEER